MGLRIGMNILHNEASAPHELGLRYPLTEVDFCGRSSGAPFYGSSGSHSWKNFQFPLDLKVYTAYPERNCA